MKFIAKVAKNSEFLLNQILILRNFAKMSYKQKYLVHLVKNLVKIGPIGQ